MIGAENGLGYAAPAFDLVILDSDGVLVDSEQRVPHETSTSDLARLTAA